MDWRNRHGCGAIGYGRSAVGIWREATNGMVVGVGLPIVSVSRPIWLWKYAVVRNPPFHQLEYVEPLRMVTPGFRSAAKRACMAAPTKSMLAGISGSNT